MPDAVSTHCFDTSNSSFDASTSGYIGRTQEFPEVVAKLMADAEVARQELGDLGHFGSQQRAAGFAGQVNALRVSQEGNSEER